MGILGLRKYVDASGCTRLLPVPLQASEQERQQQQHQDNDQEENDVNEAAHTTSHPRLSHRHHRGTTSDDNGGKSNDAEGNNSSTLGSSSLSSSLPAPHNFVAMADHVLIDMNCIVHSCFGKNAAILQRSKHELIQDILERLRVLLTEVIIPRKSLTICLDGPAPLAKLQTQRLRRRRVALMDTAGTQTLTSLAITAGSLFMVELENALAAQFKLNNGKGFLVKLCPVFLHGTTVMGEGEAKLSRALAFLASHGMPGENGTSEEEEERGKRDTAQKNNTKDVNTRHITSLSTCRNSRNERNAPRWAKTHSRHRLHTTNEGDGTRPFYNVYDSPYNPNDSVVILGNDIDLVLTGLAATMYHNISIIGPSSLQLIDIGDILYHWLKASQATGAEAAPITPAQLPSVRIDFVFLFLLNGGDHYVGAGEVALTLWKRYRIVRTAYPNDTLVSASLDAVSVEFLADVLQCETYSGDAEANIGLQLIHSALWSLYTVVTGECVDYGYCPSPSAPYVNHLRAAMSLCRQQRRRYVKLPGMTNKNNNSSSTETAHNNKYNRNVLRHSLASTADEEGDRHGGRLSGSSSGRSTVRPTPLTPLETFVALMPSEAAMPASIAQTLRQPTHYALGQRLLSSNDAHEIATAATTVVELSEPFLSRSEQYLRQFTPPVQLNVLPRRKRLSRYEQHRLREWQASARTGQNVPSALRALDAVPIVQALTIAPVDPQLYTSTHYPVECKALWFCSPFTRTSLAEANKLHKGQQYKQQKQIMKKKAMDAAKNERRVVYISAGHDSTSFASQQNKQHAVPHAEDTNSATSNNTAKNSNTTTIDTVTTPIASSVAATVRHTMERVLRNEHRRQARQNQMKKANKKSQRGSRRINEEGNDVGENNNDKKRCVMRPSAAVSSKLHSAQELGEKRLREEDAKYTEAHRLHRRERQTFLQQLRDFVGEKDVVRALGLDEKEETSAPSVAASKPAHETKKDKKKKNKAAKLEQKKMKKAAAKASKKAVRPASKAQPPRRR